MGVHLLIFVSRLVQAILGSSQPLHLGMEQLVPERRLLYVPFLALRLHSGLIIGFASQLEALQLALAYRC
jgi:hypothetical protein